ncbi:hypothetical protein FBZ33_2731 [Micromonospora sp. A202]|nr:hypothetical protein FBZ33_2731 [Micromonospora sp. A202]
MRGQVGSQARSQSDRGSHARPPDHSPAQSGCDSDPHCQPRIARMTAVFPSSSKRCTTHPPGLGSAPGWSHPTRPPPSACIATLHPGPAMKPPPPPPPLASVSRTLTPPSSTEDDTVHLPSGNLTEPEKDTLQSPSAHALYLVPPPLGACVLCAALGSCDSSAVGEEDAEGSASRGLGGEAAREAVVVATVSGLDHVASEDDSALELQPATAKTSSKAPIAGRLAEESRQCCMRGV